MGKTDPLIAAQPDTTEYRAKQQTDKNITHANSTDTK